MGRNIPLKSTEPEKGSSEKENSKQKQQEEDEEVTPYDIILENVELSYEKIPKFIKILKTYQNECEREARYMEAEVAKHRINDMKYYMTEFKKEIIRNYHLKEHCEVEEAYIQEFHNFNKFWDQKMKEFDENSRHIEIEFEEKQKKKFNDYVERLNSNDKINKTCITNEVQNFQKIEQTLARQKNYIEAQRTRIEWQNMIKANFDKFKQEHEKQKILQIDDYEKKQKREKEEFMKKLEDLNKEQEKTRKTEQDRLILKYEKIKKDLNNIQESERKAIDRDMPIIQNEANTNLDATNKTMGHDKKMNSFAEKKKVLQKKISKLDYFPS